MEDFKLNTEITETAIGYWLKSKNLQHTWAKMSQIDGLKSLIVDGKLKKEELDTGIIEIEEHGAKTIYLRKLKSLDKIADQTEFEKYVREKIDSSLSSNPKRKLLKPVTQRLNYGVYTKDTIRYKFSETHEYWAATKGVYQREIMAKTCFITYVIERKTGFMMILLDPPGNKHDHLDEKGRPSKTTYFNAFLQKADVLFGESETYPIETGIRNILLQEPPIVLCARLGYLGDDGTFWRGLNGKSGLRHNREAMKALKGGKPLPTAQFRFDKKSAAQKLQRDLWVSVTTLDGILKIRAECLAEEIEYAVSTIRKYQESAS